jgi:hypothetical protein
VGSDNYIHYFWVNVIAKAPSVRKKCENILLAQLTVGVLAKKWKRSLLVGFYDFENVPIYRLDINVVAFKNMYK